MKITVNGKEIQVESGITVAMLVEQKGLNPATIVVEYNETIVRQEQWPDIVLNSGDCLEIVAFVGGGCC